ncbi:MAG: helix-turn-helix transcriptional regulator [Eubacterium sp.]|nr:helix-turn-helix transcriptional regulator [Eubacterium sp.]
MKPEVDYKKIGERVREARLKKNLNQSQLAELVDCSNNHISHIEIGQTKLSLPLLLQISHALDESLDYFLVDTPFAKKDYVINVEISRKLNMCRPSTLIVINKVIDALLEQQKEYDKRSAE